MTDTAKPATPDDVEQRWALAQQSAGFGVWDLDLLRDEVHYSPQWKTQLGFEPTVQRDPTELWRSRVHPDDLQPMRQALLDHAEGRSESYEKEFRMQSADGSYRWMLSRGRVAARDADGRALRMVGMITDLTDRREAETLMQARDRAQSARRTKAEFLSRMSHELRTPLNAVVGLAQLFKRRAGDIDVAEQRRYALLIEDAGRQLLRMVNDMLELSGMESGLLHRPVQLAPVAVMPVLQEAVDASRPRAMAVGIDVQLNPPAHTAAWVLADAGRFKQVVAHLLDNALKFNRPQGSVCIDVQAHAHGWMLSFTDTGVGIAESHLPYLFEPFSRPSSGGSTAAATADRPLASVVDGPSSIAGLGIGLALSRWFVDCMGGRLSVRSTPGQGSTFELLLPACAAPMTPGQTPGQTARRAAA